MVRGGGGLILVHMAKFGQKTSIFGLNPLSRKKLSNFKPHYILSLSTGLHAPVYSACVLISTWTIVSLDKSLLGQKKFVQEICLEILLGKFVWKFCLEISFGNFVWKICLEISFGRQTDTPTDRATS